MKLFRIAAGFALPLMLTGAAVAQNNTQDIKDAHKQAKQDEKVDKAQTKADKDTRKALKSHKVKKAAKSQDKADAEADKANRPPQ